MCMVNYVSKMNDDHFDLFEWTSRSARLQTCAGEAAKRGRGPAHHAAELPLEQAYALLRLEHWQANAVASLAQV